jgi:endonuclease YncB( thermonuclease family)
LDVSQTLKTVSMLALAFTSPLPQTANSRPKALEGPIPAFVERVIDGDTLLVRARIWLGQELRVMVRVNGIDTPELRSRCLEERRLAVSARHFVKRLVGQRKISLSGIRQGKYAGRVIAEVTDQNGVLLSKRLLKASLARPYKHGRRKSWCSKTPAPRYKKAQLKSLIKTVAP